MTARNERELSQTRDVALPESLATRDLSQRAALETNPNLNFYIVTGWGEQVQSEIPSNLLVQGVLSKPIDLHKLDRIAAMVT